MLPEAKHSPTRRPQQFVRLAISLSDDEGRTWRWTRQLADAPGQRFDYPSVIQARDGRLHVTFSDNLKTVRHVVLREEDVRR